MTIVDMSAEIAPSPEWTPAVFRTEIEYSDHAAGAAQAEALLHVRPDLFRNGEGWATETITRLGTHDSTHVDAPWHYNSRLRGTPAQTIDELPLDWFFGPGVVLDMRPKEDGDSVTTEDLQNALTNIGHALLPRNIVLIRTGRDAFYQQPDYAFRGPGVTPEATLWLWDQGIRVMGIDAWGWDAPLDQQAREATESGQPGILWAAHQIDRPYAHIERLVNLGNVPPTGATIACFPLKIRGAGAGPCRAVAIVP